jgi:hypothetical protein
MKKTGKIRRLKWYIYNSDRLLLRIGPRLQILTVFVSIMTLIPQKFAFLHPFRISTTSIISLIKVSFGHRNGPTSHRSHSSHSRHSRHSRDGVHGGHGVGEGAIN